MRALALAVRLGPVTAAAQIPPGPESFETMSAGAMKPELEHVGGEAGYQR